MAISGHGGTSVSSFTSALSDAAEYLNSQGSGTGQGGIYDYGTEPTSSTANSVLDPNSIKTDNIRDSSSSSSDNSPTKKDPTEDKAERYKDIDEAIENLTRSVEKLTKAEKRLYGQDRINAMKEETSELLKQKEATE
jgi:hypothetical protein